MKKLLFAILALSLPCAAQVTYAPTARLLQSTTFSAAASVQFANWYSAAYKNYLIVVSNVSFSTASDLQFQFSTNGGTSYDAGTNYNWAGYFTSAALAGGASGTAATNFPMRGGNTTLPANGTYGASLTLLSPAAGNYKHLVGQVAFDDATNTLFEMAWAGTYKSTSPVNAFQILSAAGTMSGTVSIYGFN